MKSEFDFRNPVPSHMKDLLTVFDGKSLLLKNIYAYHGPVTMQRLPCGGIQSVCGGHLIIYTQNGFIACDEVALNGTDLSSEAFIAMYPDIVNRVLPDRGEKRRNSMNRIAEFEKVSLEQFEKDYLNSFPELNLKNIELIYHRVRMPRRATSGSAGYDFFAPFDIELAPGETLKVPTGIRCRMDEGWLLTLFPRSGLGFKYRLQLNNTVGIIDSDYYGSSNEGHIYVKLTNDSNEGRILSVKEGEGLVQGIFLPYGLTVDDEATAVRDGGFGSTTK